MVVRLPALRAKHLPGLEKLGISAGSYLGLGVDYTRPGPVAITPPKPNC